jgi:hypothetical protein
MRTPSEAPLSFGDGGDVEVSPRRCAQPDMVSIADVSACGHSSGRLGAAIAAPTAAMGWLIVAAVSVGRSWLGAPTLTWLNAFMEMHMRIKVYMHMAG